MPPAKAPPARGKGKGGKPELTEEQKQEIREAFDLFDTDGSGDRATPRKLQKAVHLPTRCHVAWRVATLRARADTVPLPFAPASRAPAQAPLMPRS